jgi:tripartite-type tricarboxylate transporter receptor subunit TctC
VKLPRRQFLHLAAGAAALPAMSRVAWADSYPSRPVRVITSFPAGNVDDMLARLIEQSLSERLGQPFAMENQPIAMATETIRNASPDGHTLALVTAANVIATILDEKLNFSFVRDATPVTGISRNPFVVVVNPSFPAKTVPELIAYAKANPGKIKMAGPSGSILRFAGELFKMTTEVKIVHAPYEVGGAGAERLPWVSALLSGEAQLLFATMPMAIEHIRAGRLRALAVTTAMRSEMLPDIPTVGEFVPGYEASGIQGLWAPRNTPSGVIDRLNKETNAALADPKFKERLGQFGNTLLPGSTAEYGKTMVNETEKWTKVIRVANTTSR